MSQHGLAYTFSTPHFLYFKLQYSFNFYDVSRVDDEVKKYYQNHDRFICIYDLSEWELNTMDSIELTRRTELEELEHGKLCSIYITLGNEHPARIMKAHITNDKYINKTIFMAETYEEAFQIVKSFELSTTEFLDKLRVFEEAYNTLTDLEQYQL